MELQQIPVMSQQSVFDQVFGIATKVESAPKPVNQSINTIMQAMINRKQRSADDYQKAVQAWAMNLSNSELIILYHGLGRFNSLDPAVVQATYKAAIDSAQAKHTARGYTTEYTAIKRVKNDKAWFDQYITLLTSHPTVTISKTRRATICRAPKIAAAFKEVHMALDGTRPTRGVWKYRSTYWYRATIDETLKVLYDNTGLALKVFQVLPAMQYGEIPKCSPEVHAQLSQAFATAVEKEISLPWPGWDIPDVKMAIAYLARSTLLDPTSALTCYEYRDLVKAGKRTDAVHNLENVIYSMMRFVLQRYGKGDTHIATIGNTDPGYKEYVSCFYQLRACFKSYKQFFGPKQRARAVTEVFTGTIEIGQKLDPNITI